MYFIRIIWALLVSIVVVYVCVFDQTANDFDFIGSQTSMMSSWFVKSFLQSILMYFFVQCSLPCVGLQEVKEMESTGWLVRCLWTCVYTVPYTSRVTIMAPQLF